MRLPDSAHTERPWRIHALTPDFRLEDVWALPTPGGPDDFPRLVQSFAAGDPARGSSRAVRALWAIRWKLGGLLGWDDPDAGVGTGVPTLRDRLPADLRDSPSGPDVAGLPFAPLFLLEDEWAAEIVNRTMHGVLHLGWVPDGRAGYRGQLAVLVKPNGLLGTAYMAAITPFRRALVYPQMLRQIGRAWRARGGVRGTMSPMSRAFVHTCVRVRDPEASVRFYEALGFERRGRLNFASAYNLYLGLPGGGDTLELTVNRGHDERYDLGTGYNHLAITVDDIHAALAALEPLGVAPEKPPYHPGDREDLPLIAFVADPDGYRIELIDGGAFATPQDPDA